MDEPQAFGREGNEVKAGYTPLKEPQEVGASTAFDVKEAAAEIGARRPEPKEPEKIKYYDKGTGENLDQKFAVTPEKAGRDLSQMRRDKETIDGVFSDIELGQAVDDERAIRKLIAGEDPYPTPPAQTQGGQQGQEAPAHEQPTVQEHEAPQDGLDPRVRELMSHPEVRAALEGEFGKAQQLHAEIAQEIDNAHRLATQAVLMSVPELAGMPLEHVPGALAMLAQHNPQRHAQVVGQLQTAQALQARHAQIQQANAEHAAKQFDTWATEQDAKFDKQNPEFSDPVKAPQERAKVINYLKAVGVPEAQIPKLHKTELFRDAIAQQIIADAARWHAAKESARNATQRELPPPQRPGTPQPRGDDNAERIERLSSRLPSLKGESAFRAAASLMKANRQGRR